MQKRKIVQYRFYKKNCLPLSPLSHLLLSPPLTHLSPFPSFLLPSAILRLQQLMSNPTNNIHQAFLHIYLLPHPIHYNSLYQYALPINISLNYPISHSNFYFPLIYIPFHCPFHSVPSPNIPILFIVFLLSYVYLCTEIHEQKSNKLVTNTLPHPTA